jgi:DNA-directed RNA polymerase specialized sigma24 family protein
LAGRTRRAFYVRIEPWERELAAAASRRIDTRERDELKAELIRHLICLKSHPTPHIRNWRAFISVAMRNKASNWIRDQQAKDTRFTSSDQPSGPTDEASPLIEVLPFPEPDRDQRIALARAYDDLDHALKTFWRVLLEEDGNQVKTAQRLGIHRNTVRARIREIQRVLIAHGFPVARGVNQ